MQSSRPSRRRDPGEPVVGERSDAHRWSASWRTRTSTRASVTGIGLGIDVELLLGKASSSSSKVGTGSVPPSRAVRMSDQVISAMSPVGRTPGPGPRHGWRPARRPAVRCTSVSRYTKPVSTAAAKADRLFSGAASVPPRWAKGRGAWCSRNGCETGRVLMVRAYRCPDAPAWRLDRPVKYGPGS